MAVLNITPTMDLQNIDTINTPNASQMLNTNNTVPHPTIQCLLYEVFFNTIYLDSTPKHLPHRQDHPLYPSSVHTLFYVQSYVIFMHRARVNLKPLRMMNVNNDPSSVNIRITTTMFGGTLCHSAVRFNRVTECLVILKAIHNYDRRMCNLLNITPTMDLQNIDTINTPNASQMLNTNNTVPHPTIQCLLYEVFFNTIYLD
eukprot:697290_1